MNTDAKTCDAQDLVLAHQAFRRLYGLAPAAVLNTDPTNRRRVRSVASTLKTVNSALHHHHAIEDAHLWDKLAQRRPACGLHVELMKQQHGTVAGLLDGCPPLIEAWRRRPGPSTAEPLAARFAEIDGVLRVHLEAEEARILPVIEQVISAREWEQLGDDAQARYTPTQIALFLGLILELMPPEERVRFEAELPGPMTFVWTLVGRRFYERLMAGLDAGGTRSIPPRSATTRRP